MIPTIILVTSASKLILLTIVSMLYISTPYSFICNWKLVSLNFPFQFLLLSLLSGNHICSLYLWLFFYFVKFVHCFLKFHIFVFLWVTYSLHIIPYSSIHVVTNGNFFPFLWLINIPVCVCIYICVW